MMSPNFVFDLESFVDLFSYLPIDIQSFLFATTMILLVLALRRVLF